MPYRLIKIGNSKCREYLSINRSPLFKDLPQKDFAQLQKESYNFFLDKGLKKIINFYFPTNPTDYNNNASIEIKKIILQEPEISEEEAEKKRSTWQRSLDLELIVKWECYKIQIQLTEENNIEKSISLWIEKSFKVRSFSLKKISDEKWEAISKKEKWKLLIDILSKEEGYLVIKFHCEQEKIVFLCHFPEMNSRGEFTINGHKKVAIFQSVRAPNAYFFINDKGKLLGEVIPLKGPWFRIYLDNFRYGEKKEIKQIIKVKFLNTGYVFTLFNLLKEFSLTDKDIDFLFGSEEAASNSCKSISNEKDKKSPPRVVFEKENSYFVLGSLGRKNLNKKLNIFVRITGQTLAEDWKSEEGKIILPKGSFLHEKNINIIRQAIKDKQISPVKLSNYSKEDLYICKVYSPRDEKKIINVLGFASDQSETKTHFDLADFLCIISYFANSNNGIGKLEKEKDNSESQIIRRVGELVHNILDSELGSFLQNIDRKYLATISQLEKADLTGIPYRKEIDRKIKKFFHISTLVQMQNENNPISSASYVRKSSSLGLGGFSSINASPEMRDIKSDNRGRLDLIETSEGSKIYLGRSLTINAEINDYNQITASYYKVKNGKIIPEMVNLSAEEETNKYISHCHIKINDKNEIEEKELLSQYNGKFVLVKREKIDYIYSSYYHLNSLASAAIPIFPNNYAVRMLMATSMMKQVQIITNPEAPLVVSGLEENLLEFSSLTVKSPKEGTVEYVDSEKVVIKGEDGKKFEKKIKQFAISNKNTLFTSSPLVKKGEKVSQGKLLACGDYSDKQMLSMGINLRVAILPWYGKNFEDAIVLREGLNFNSLLVKVYTIVRKKTKHGDEVFTSSLPHLWKKRLDHLDEEGIVKIGSKVDEGDILVGKITPDPTKVTETSEQELLREIFGQKSSSYIDSSLTLPWGEKGTVYNIERWDKKQLEETRKENSNYSPNDLELIRIAIARERKVEEGDKFASRFGNKGIIGEIVSRADMPFDEEGIVDMVINPLSIPSRMNTGQLIEIVLGLAARKLGTQILIRPFNNISSDSIEEVMKEAKISNYGFTRLRDGKTGLQFSQEQQVGFVYYFLLDHKAEDKFNAQSTGPYSPGGQPVKGRKRRGRQRSGEMENWALMSHGAAYNLAAINGIKSDDIRGRSLLNRSLISGDRQVDLNSTQSESFNIFLQHLWASGFDPRALNYQGKEIKLMETYIKRKKDKKVTE